MALPSLSTPKYITNLPSTGEEIEYRPFLVKEEKLLLMAMEGQDEKEIQRAIISILNDCIITDINIDKLSVFDVEFLFLNLRGKSVGEVIELKISHPEGDCDHKSDVTIQIDDIKVQGEISDGKITLTDQIGVKLRYPSLNDATKYANDDPQSLFKLIASCIEFVWDQDQVYNDFTLDEMVDWLDTLDQNAFKNISKFFESSPKLSHTISWNCKKCGKDDSILLEGLSNFFT